MVKLIYDNTKNVDLFYKVRADIHDAFFYLEIDDVALIFLDQREIGVFNEGNKNINLQAVLLEPFLDQIAPIGGNEKAVFKLAMAILSKYNLFKEQIIVPVTFPLDMADYLRAHNVLLVPVEPLYSERIAKTQAEIEFIKDNLHKTFLGYQLVEKILQDSVIKNQKIVYQGNILTSEFLKQEVERVFLQNDLILSDGIIISSGLQSAMPHHSGKDEILPYQPIICDFFPRSRVNGYYADMTRTYFKGQPNAEILKMYKSVLLAQEAAIKLIKPGVKTSMIHQQCVDSFINDGYAVGNEGFVHGTGHGLGLQIHELPFLNARSQEILASGNIFSVEPGLYYEKLGGVRIEDIVLVTSTGYENLTDYPKELKIF